MSAPLPAERRVEKAERKRFEGWMRRYWAGVPLRKVPGLDEYTAAEAQVGWELWKRFTLLPLEKR